MIRHNVKPDQLIGPHQAAITLCNTKNATKTPQNFIKIILTFTGSSPIFSTRIFYIEAFSKSGSRLDLSPNAHSSPDERERSARCRADVARSIPPSEQQASLKDDRSSRRSTDLLAVEQCRYPQHKGVFSCSHTDNAGPMRRDVRSISC